MIRWCLVAVLVVCFLLISCKTKQALEIKTVKQNNLELRMAGVSVVQPVSRLLLSSEFKRSLYRQRF